MRVSARAAVAMMRYTDEATARVDYLTSLRL